MRGRMIEFAGKTRPCYWPMAAIEEYSELVDVPFEKVFAKIHPTKLLFIGLKWGAIAENIDFDLDLIKVQLEYDDSSIDAKDLAKWFSDDLQPILEKAKKKQAAVRKK